MGGVGSIQRMTIDIVDWIRKRLLRHLPRLVRSGDIKANEVWPTVVELVGAGLGPEKDVFGFYDCQSVRQLPLE